MGGVPACDFLLAVTWRYSTAYVHLPSISQRKVRPVTADNSEQLDLDVSGITSAEVATFTGDVVVEAGAEKPHLIVTLRGKTEYKVERLGNLLYVSAKKHGLTYSGSGASFHLWLPAGLKYKLATVSGVVRVRGPLLRLNASTVSGEIEVQAAGQAELHMSTVSGSVTVGGARGRIKASTVSGDVRLADVEGQIDASSTKGSMSVTDAAGRITLSTGKGTIQVADLRGQIQASSGAGGIRLERVTFEPGTRSGARTGAGAVEVYALHAPGGLRIKGHSSRLHADLPGYDVQGGRGSLRAQLAGANPASLELATPGEIRITV